MKDNNSKPVQDYSRPVAYDVDGNPLYAHPPSSSGVEASPSVVHIMRSSEPQKVEVSDAVRLKHEKSCKLYPELNLSHSEFIISAIKRHPIGLVAPVIIGLFLIIISIILFFGSDGIISSASPAVSEMISPTSLAMTALIFMFVTALGVFVFIYVYTKNRFFLTNESVVQEIQTGLFYKHEQTVSLLNIEDASYYQNGPIQQIFNYGTIRLSTEGDETTYVFTYVANPKKEVAKLNNAVEAFKNGRPVVSD